MICKKWLIKSEKNVYTTYYLDKRANILSTFEGTSIGDLHTVSVDNGVGLGFEGTSSETINGHKCATLNGAG